MLFYVVILLLFSASPDRIDHMLFYVVILLLFSASPDRIRPHAILCYNTLAIFRVS